MALNISVRKNHLPTCVNPFIVRSDSSEVVEFDRLVEIMAKGRTTLTKTDIVAAMQLYKEETIKQLADGKTVKTPTGSFYLCAAGSMASLDEAFLPRDQATNHEIRLHHRPDKGFEQAVLDDLLIVRDERPDLGSPKILSLQPVGEEASGSIRAGGIVRIKGLRLRFDAKESGLGVFFIGESGAAERSPFYPMIQPSTVMASVPGSLAAGTYAVAIRAAVNGKDVRESRIEGIVVTAA
jgi:hypothetical protein